MDTKVLFICSANCDSSPTAEKVFGRYSGLETWSTGIMKNDETIDGCLRWADAIVVMEKHHKEYICKHFAEAIDEKPIFTLDIPDNYFYMQDSLVSLIQERMQPVLKEIQKKS